MASFTNHRFAGYGILKSNFYIGGPSLKIMHRYTREEMEFSERLDCEWIALPLGRDQPFIKCDDIKNQGYDIDMIRGQCVKLIDQGTFEALKLKLDNSGAIRGFPTLENNKLYINSSTNDIQRDEQQHWLWVTRPEYYLDENGKDREDLDPGWYDPDSWWTCHKDTKEGDLAFLWRAKLKRDIGYLIRAESDAYRFHDADDKSNKGWIYRCNFRVLYKFRNTITAKELRNDSFFYDWSPLKINFQGSVFRIKEPYWDRINQIALAKNPDYDEVVSPESVIEAIVDEDLNSLDIEEGREERYNEGGKLKRYVNYYERNRGLNIAARRIHGTKCMVCGFDFGKQYGERGSGYIEVHHLHPVSSLKEKTEVDPKTEMAVVCSNCHRMIHRKKDNVLSLKELKILLEMQYSQDRPNR